MKNLINRIIIEEKVEEVVTPSHPSEIKGYSLLDLEAQSFCECLSTDEWENFIGDCLRAKAMDKAFAKVFA